MVLPSKVSPLADSVPIVRTKDGTPTTYFVRQLQQLLDEKANTDELAAGAVQDADLTEILEALELGDLADVNVPAPTDGQVLTWNDSSSTWDAEDATGGGGFSYEGGPPRPPLIADYPTWDNQGTSSIADGTNMMIFTPQADGNPHGRYTTAPATPWTYYWKSEQQSFSTAGITTQLVSFGGVMLKDTATTNRRLYFGMYSERISGDENINYAALCQRYDGSAVPVFNANSGILKYTLKPWKWFKLTNDGTTLTLYCSFDGINWVSAGTETLATWIGAAGSVGVFGVCVANNTAETVQFPYLSRTAPVLSLPTVAPTAPLYVTTTAVGIAANTTEQVLQSYTIPANTLTAGHELRLRVEGTVINSSRTKTARVKVGATSLDICGIGTGSLGWSTWISIKATASNAQTIYSNGLLGALTGAGTGFQTRTTSAEDLTGPVTIQITGQTTATAVANDIVCDLLTVELL